MAMQTNDTKNGFQFQGSYTESDIDTLARFTVAQLLDQRIGRATVSATILLAIGAVLLRSWPVAIGGFLAILGISALVRYVVLPRKLIQHARQMPGTAGNRTIVVDRQGLHHLGGGGEQVFSRSAIRRLVIHKAHLFILLKPAGCLMLPLSWIQPPATIEAVVRLLVERGDE